MVYVWYVCSFVWCTFGMCAFLCGVCLVCVPFKMVYVWDVGIFVVYVWHVCQFLCDVLYVCYACIFVWCCACLEWIALSMSEIVYEFHVWNSVRVPARSRRKPEALPNPSSSECTRKICATLKLKQTTNGGHHQGLAFNPTRKLISAIGNCPQLPSFLLFLSPSFHPTSAVPWCVLAWFVCRNDR